MRALYRSRRLNLPFFSSIGPSGRIESQQRYARQASRCTSTTTISLLPPRTKRWLTRAGQKNWIVLTKDHRIRYRNLERAALMKAGVGAFVLTAGDLKGDEMAQIFVKALPAISRFLRKHRRPFIAKVARSGSVSMLLK